MVHSLPTAAEVANDKKRFHTSRQAFVDFPLFMQLYTEPQRQTIA